MKELIDEGAIGVVQHVTTTFFGNGFRGRNHAWLNDRDLGGGWIGAWGSHAVDMLRWFLDSEVADCGGVSRVETRMRPDGAGGQRLSTAEDAFTAWFVMQNGCTASIDTGFSASVPMPQRLMVMGSEGALELVNDAKLIRRGSPAEDPSMPREERIRRAVLAAEGELIMQLPPPQGDVHEALLTGWLGRIKEALAAGRADFALVRRRRGRGRRDWRSSRPTSSPLGTCPGDRNRRERCGSRTIWLGQGRA